MKTFSIITDKLPIEAASMYDLGNGNTKYFINEKREICFTKLSKFRFPEIEISSTNSKYQVLKEILENCKKLVEVSSHEKNTVVIPYRNDICSVTGDSQFCPVRVWTHFINVSLICVEHELSPSSSEGFKEIKPFLGRKFELGHFDTNSIKEMAEAYEVMTS